MSGENNAGAALIRALNLPLRDVHDLCATADVEYLERFLEDERHREQHGLGRPHSAARKATSPVRRAEYLQGSKLAERLAKEAEERELKMRQRKVEENRRRRKADADAAARADQLSDAGDSDARMTPRGAGGGAAAGRADDADRGSEEGGDEADLTATNKAKPLNASLLVSVGAGSTDKDRVPVDKVFPRPRLGKTALAATEEAFFNTVGLGITSVRDLVQFRDEHGFLPVHTAAVHGHTRVLDFLLYEAKADIEAEVPGSLLRPLHLLVLNGHEMTARNLANGAADPGALTADFQTPISIARSRRSAHLEMHLGKMLAERVVSANALQAAVDGEVAFFVYHAECDKDGGRAVFTADLAPFRPKDKARPASAGASGVSVDALVRDPISTPLDIAIASMKDTAPAAERRRYAQIAELLLRGKHFELNALRESAFATTPLYLACSVPSRDAVELLVRYGADPRVAGAIGSAPSPLLKLTLAEAEARMLFEELYATRNAVAFEAREEFVVQVTALRDKWRVAQKKLARAREAEALAKAAAEADAAAAAAAGEAE